MFVTRVSFQKMLSFVSLILHIALVRKSNASQIEECNFIDLTHDFDSETLYWNKLDKFEHPVVFKGKTSPFDYYYESYKLTSAEHGGTHVDAPSHFNEFGKNIDQVPISQLIGPACVINVTENVKHNHEYRLAIDDLKMWENNNNKSLNDCLLFMNAGWAKLYPNRGSYFGSDSTNVLNYRFPGMSPDTAKWLIDNRRIKVFGLDTPSLDFGRSNDFMVHRILNGNNIVGMENLNNLDKLPEWGATVIAMPMKIKSGSGGPLRIVAFGWDGPNDPCRRN